MAPMNYLAHALPFLDDPYFVAGTAVPDWLTVVDRRVRVRAKGVEPLVGDPDGVTAAVAGGVLQHLRDDRHFHASRALAETSIELAAAIRRVWPSDGGFGAGFAGHLLVEVLLDAALAAERPAALDAYYRALQAVDGRAVEEAVNRMATQPTGRLAAFMALFGRAADLVGLPGK